MTVFKVGTFELPVCAGFDIIQRFEPIGGEVILRMMSGLGVKQMTFNKKRITTSGTGWVPTGLSSLDFSVTHEIACIVPETLPADFTTRSVELPDFYREDDGHIPYGLAQMPDGQTVASTVTIGEELVATVDEVDGAVAYQVAYYPLVTCWLMRPTCSGPDHTWEMVAEEE